MSEPYIFLALLDGKVVGWECEDVIIDTHYGSQLIDLADLPLPVTASDGTMEMRVIARKWRRLGEDEWVGYDSLAQAFDKLESQRGEFLHGEWRLDLSYNNGDMTYSRSFTVSPGSMKGFKASDVFEHLTRELRGAIKAVLRRHRLVMEDERQAREEAARWEG